MEAILLKQDVPASADHGSYVGGHQRDQILQIFRCKTDEGVASYLRLCEGGPAFVEM